MSSSYLADQNLRLAKELLDRQGEINELKERLQRLLDITEVLICPFDCDSCHNEDCPCPRLGCAGYEESR